MSPQVPRPRSLSESPPNRLSELRKARGLKWHEVTAVIQRDTSMIQRYEQGLSQVPDDVKLKLAAHYGVTVDYLMGWDRDMEDTAA